MSVTESVTELKDTAAKNVKENQVNYFDLIKPWQFAHDLVNEEFCKCKEFYYSYALFPESENTFQIQRFCQNCGNRFKPR
jgi:hypothetical protein